MTDCTCGYDGEMRACCDGSVYGACDHENCGGVCDFESDCECDCHRPPVPSPEETPPMTVNIIRTPDDLIHVTAGYGTSISPDEADAVARRLNEMAWQIRRDAARAVCAVEGHVWWGSNAYRYGNLDDKIHIRYCEREYCGLREEDDGWSDVVYPPRDPS